MTQLSMLTAIEKQVFYTLTYDGVSHHLQNHSIDVSLYSPSILGYSNIIKCLTSDLLNLDVEVVLVSEKEGSFKTIMKVGFRCVEGASAILGILSFFGIEYQDVKTTIDDVQTKIIEVVKEEPGGLDSLIERIRQDPNLSNDEKEKLIKSLKNKTLRKSLDNFTKPLDHPDYSLIQGSSENEILFEIKKIHRENFKYVPAEEEIVENFNDTVKIVYLSPDLNKWMFKGKKEIWAEVLDSDFIRRTKDKRASDLRNVEFWAVGRKITTRKPGDKRRTITWEIDSIGEVRKQANLDYSSK